MAKNRNTTTAPGTHVNAAELLPSLDRTARQDPLGHRPGRRCSGG